MSDPKHTPGPWEVDSLSEHGYLLVKPAGGQVVAQVDPVAEAEANARLIAAVPELLAMLKRCVKYVPASAVAGELIMDAPIDECRIRTLAEKLIARAEGRAEA